MIYERTRSAVEVLAYGVHVNGASQSRVQMHRSVSDAHPYQGHLNEASQWSTCTPQWIVSVFVGMSHTAGWLPDHATALTPLH
jgi:hypothetical protein